MIFIYVYNFLSLLYLFPMSTFVATSFLSQITLQNIVTVNETSLVKNFKMITQCLQHFSDFQQKITNLQKNSTNIMQEIERGKKKQEKEMSEIKNVIKFITVNLEMGDEYFIDSKDHNEAEEGSPMKRRNSARNSSVAGQIEAAEARIRNELLSEILKAKEEQLQHPTIKRMEKQIEDLREKVDQLSNTKALDSKLFTLDKEIKQITESVRSGKLDHTQLVTYIDKSIEMINGQFGKIENKIEEFRVNQINIDDKIKMKADCSDLFKLEQMLLGMLDTTSNQLVKKMCDKQETKRALVFLEKRINKVVGLMVGEPGNDEEKDALLAAKSWKCVSCTKDLGEYQGKLDQYKPWAVFPAKTITKDKYHGFGVGFQEVMEKAVEKKGVEASYDGYGRMTVPHNLTREVNVGSNKSGTPMTKHRSNSQSQSKIKPSFYQTQQAPIDSGNNSLQTNFMNNFGGNYEAQVNVVDEYKKKYKGIGTLVIDSIKDGSK